ncbi:hypothetical protein CPB83DRAFT_404650 [Crepidotus variabilis]|uniref:Uncharacterized protein n=1 Tax=Crepidotus variabilis TaxID=179855 RepID=A0A9P6JP78_9AGAR|nr:hypothetical protein CPB83DRAFT_404650 [Crepidotus variabilis]
MAAWPASDAGARGDTGLPVSRLLLEYPPASWRQVDPLYDHMPDSRLYTFNLPNELEEAIIQIAARLDKNCALNLLRTARYIHNWVHPILYERICLQSATSATCLMRTLRKLYSFPPRNFGFKRAPPFPLSLTLSADIKPYQIEVLLGQLSKNLITYTIFRTFDDPNTYLGLIKSPFIRRVILVYSKPEAHYQGHLIPRGERLPSSVLSTITYLALVSDSVGSASQHFAALEDDSKSLTPPFSNLTCFAISWTRWSNTWRYITRHAKALKCFAILGPSNAHLDLQSKLSILEELRASPRDPRFVLLVHGGYGEPSRWTVKDGFHPNLIWGRIEDLVKNHFICDDGEKWSESVVAAFREKSPQIRL